MAVYEQGVEPRSGAARTGVFVNYAGAAVSLALMAGVGVWGYKLIVRDVSGIPVVRAMTGEMRVAPENPGGDVAPHQGLLVNEVAAIGEAAAPLDRLVLAPATAGLSTEDLEAQPTAEAGEVLARDAVDGDEVAIALSAITPPDAVAEPLNAADVLALADQIAANAAPLSDLAPGETVAADVSLDGQAIAAAPAGPVSLRPVSRPVSAVDAALAEATAAVQTAPAATQVAVTTEEFATGTKLVQLGAFPTAEGAAEAWTQLSGRFDAFMGGKDRVIQVASSGGRTFYRLRAAGFGDLNDARRFCAALVAESADCIPVVVR